MKRLRILTLVSVLLAACIFFLKKRNPTTIAAGQGLVLPKAWLVANVHPVTPLKGVRPADQTFLTYPEWYLVFSPEEQAHYYTTHTATSFPFMAHTAQIWQGYKIVYSQIKDNFPYNGGYHFMIWVIGSSASVEYSIKAWYETVIGRVTDTHDVLTDEDRFNAKFTQDYVDFIKDNPWYAFDFKSRLATLWGSTPLFGNHFLRKVERRYILTSELLVKAVYGKLIGLGTQTVYDEALPVTAVLVDSLPANTNVPVMVKRFADSSVLVNLPRYDKFNAAVNALAKSGARFREVAGNNSAILLTVLVPAGTNPAFGNAQVVFTQPVASSPATKRVAIATPVANLHTLLLELDKAGMPIEHVFDY